MNECEFDDPAVEHHPAVLEVTYPTGRIPSIGRKYACRDHWVEVVREAVFESTSDFVLVTMC